MFVVTVKFIVKDTFQAQFMEAVNKQAKDSLDLESECHYFDVCTSKENNNEVFLYEIYESAKAFEQHLMTSHFKSFNQKTTDWIESKKVETFKLAK
ncbi:MULTISPECIES: putative quinol monooxygenase [Aliiglaciecola]|uniref:putative quinol monooxygenase n=1 Tax=Aliiglaciecola TaxID=1406885 RepID=UPI001C08E8B2|nr:MULTISPECIES: antibiotic biosynthesis monooxygenase [Aliiglaciecola]MBU2879899.1 antibiotic biosynthesis monooxygenase [Aliiglaciecola lipolytica]MDO6712417.1 antibiotic biosynthesis monooxygenase [Aliiglaciecola sp. 2_MG-2023]MDO6753411.1 antibiotic biosynthesis monooxygenase [Aliiglaciecola sp. 1_MG-2023]